MGCIVALALVVSCSTDGATDAPGACSAAEGEPFISRSGQSSPPEDLLWWAGFNDVGDLEIVGADEACGIDAAARIALRGSPAEIDAALAAAGFEGDPSPGVSVFQPPLGGIELDELTDVVTSDPQVWENEAGETITRVYVRGRTGQGEQELLHLWAFTT